MFKKMKRIFIGLIIILLIGITLSVSKFAYLDVVRVKNEHSKERTETTKYSKQRIQENFDICRRDKPNGIVNLLECVITSADSDQQTKTSAYDLKAQQDMSEWAYILVWLTGGGVLVSIAGLFALFTSLNQTRRAIKDNREIGEAQVRAYIDVVDDGITFNNNVVAEGKITNIGETVASNVNISSEVDYIHNDGSIHTEMCTDTNIVNAHLGKQDKSDIFCFRGKFDFLGALPKDDTGCPSGINEIIITYFVKFDDIFGNFVTYSIGKKYNIHPIPFDNAGDMLFTLGVDHSTRVSTKTKIQRKE